MSVLSQPHYHDEDAAYEFVEARLWPEGATCPKCGERGRVSKMKGKSTRKGVYKCYKCRKPFTMKIGTIFEGSNIKMHIWLQAIFLMCSSKKGVSANQLGRMLGVTYRTGWFIGHRIREAMRLGSLATPMGEAGGIVEIDETFIGTTDEGRKRREAARKRGKKKVFQGGFSHKNAVLTLVDRKGEARSFHIEKADTDNIMPIVRDNLDAEARVVTDDAGYYRNMDAEYEHAFVNHSAGQYSDGGEIYTNTVESYFSVFKRGMRGTYQHCKEKHLHRYLAEVDFRYNARSSLGINDEERTGLALNGVTGKRLKYRDPALTN